MAKQLIENLKKPEIQLFLSYIIITFTAVLYSRSIYLQKIFSPSGCFLLSNTGLYCPACGGTRAINALYQGSFLEALSFNLLIILLPIYIYAGYILLEMLIKKRSVNNLVISPYLIWAPLVVIVIYTITRNIPSPFFNFLRP